MLTLGSCNHMPEPATLVIRMECSDWTGMSHMPTRGLQEQGVSTSLTARPEKKGWFLSHRQIKVLLPEEGMDFIQAKGSNFVWLPSRSNSL